MASTTPGTPITSTSDPLDRLDTDLIILPWFEGDGPDLQPGLDRATGGELARALASSEFAAHPFDLFLTPIVDCAWRGRRLVLVGAGPAGSYGTDLARKIATVAGLAARQRRATRAALVLRPAPPDSVGRRQLRRHGPGGG